MANRISRILRNHPSGSGVETAIREYENRFRLDQASGKTRGLNHSTEVNDLYNDLVTDFFEYGWGRSFHFAPRIPGESFKASLARHERYLAEKIELLPGMAVADIGCGVGGPMLEIARSTGARITGINSNTYQLGHARDFAEGAGLSHLVQFLNCDFLHVDAPDGSFDAAYSIEATCFAPDKSSIYGEVFRLLKPGGHFGAYEYCLTDLFDAANPLHKRIKKDVQRGGNLQIIDDYKTVDDALVSVGFEVLETRDISIQPSPSVPWYQPLAASGVSLASFRCSRFGRSFTNSTLKALEALRVVPRGTVKVSETLNLCAAAIVEAGRLGIFTPMYFFHARKPG